MGKPLYGSGTSNHLQRVMAAVRPQTPRHAASVKDRAEDMGDTVC